MKTKILMLAVVAMAAFGCEKSTKYTESKIDRYMYWQNQRYQLCIEMSDRIFVIANMQPSNKRDSLRAIYKYLEAKYKPIADSSDKYWELYKKEK